MRIAQPQQTIVALFSLLHKLTKLQQHRNEVTVIDVLWFDSKELHGFHTNKQVELMYFISYHMDIMEPSGG